MAVHSRVKNISGILNRARKVKGALMLTQFDAKKNAEEEPKPLDSLPKIASESRKIVLIDDDPSYQALLIATAKSMNISVTAYESLGDMLSFAQLKEYSFALLDFHLKELTGVEIAEYVDVFFPNLPVFLISADEKVSDKDHTPKSIKKFYNKNSPPRSILSDAMKVIDRIDMLKKYGG